MATTPQYVKNYVDEVTVVYLDPVLWGDSDLESGFAGYRRWVEGTRRSPSDPIVLTAYDDYVDEEGEVIETFGADGVEPRTVALREMDANAVEMLADKPAGW